MRQTRKEIPVTPEDIIASLNRSIDAMKINGTPDTHNVASQNISNCLEWLRNKRVTFYQTKQGYYKLGKMPTEQHGEKNEAITVRRPKMNGTTVSE